ncbi:MAG: PTS fructose transporter subunit IIA [Oscillibacter sp.]|nr:PTS fructose transporter subunit IIA [Oscillibacter sp.]
MRYHLIVSHGGFASGMAEALGMLVGQREDVLQVSFRDGMALPAFQEQVRQVAAPITAEDEVLVMADLVNGSPLTTTMAVLAEGPGLDRVRAVGGINLPMAVAAIEGEDDPLDDTVEAMKACAKEEVKQFQTETGSDDDI